MRRKCFVLLMIVLLVLVCLHQAGVPLRTGEISVDDEKEVEYIGKIIRIQEKSDKYSLRVKLMKRNGTAVSFCEDALLTYRGEVSSAEELLNTVITFRAKLCDAQTARNPHCFNYRDYLKSCGIGKIASVNSLHPLQVTYTLKEKYERFLYKARSEFLSVTGEEAKGIVAGVLFGDTTYLPEEIYDEFRSNGTAHILAVSGLHVGILYGIYKKIAGKRRSLAALLLLAIMLFTYGTLSMWSTSALRAILMIGISTAGRYTDRRYDMLTGMSAAALILITQNPYVIFGSGFQMSFLAIASIAFFRPIIPQKIPESLATAIAVNFGLLFYQADVFNYISLVSLIVNIPIIFLTGYFVPIALLGFAASIFGIYAAPLRAAAEGFALMLTKVNGLSTLGGFSSVDVPSLPKGVTVFLLCALFFLASETFLIYRHRQEKKKIGTAFLLILSLSLAAEAFSYSEITHAQIVFVDVGQGDCIHLRAGRKNILIDGGGKIEYNTGKRTLKPYLLKNGVGKIDAALATHLHTDHYKGLTELQKCMRVDRLYTEMTAGSRLKITPKVCIETLWPLEIKEENAQDENKNCSVFMIHYDRLKILVTGDLDSEGEREMIRYYGDSGRLRADVLKVGHHGSKTSTCEEFLKCVSPKIAVIQVGKNNYGHPAAETLKRLKIQDCTILRNDQSGAIGLRLKKSSMQIHKVL